MSREEKGSGRRPVYLTAKQVAERYQMHPQWPYRCKDLKKWQRRIGKSIRFLESDLELFERERWDPPAQTHKTPGEFLMRHRCAWEETHAPKDKILFDIKD